jgi:hypothetical protein
MYSEIRGTILKIIPGSGDANYIYIGLIIFIITSFIVRQKWGAFFATVGVCVIIKVMDYFILPQTEYRTLVELVHFILAPLLITALLKKND